jgi:RNA polymerase sigma-70 factor (ECF subfamily)
MDEPLSNEQILALVLQSQEGDTEAFGTLYDHFFLPVYRYTAFRAPSELVEDLVSDIFVKVWEKLHQYEARTNVPFGAWLFRIARHTVIDAYRTQRSFDEIPEELADTDRLNQAETATRTSDVLRDVRQALSQLPRRYREVLILSYVSELTHAEIAQSLKMSEGGVRILKFRALRKLEQLLPEYKESA